MPADRPPEAWEPLFRVTRLATKPLERFLRVEASSGVLLLIATAAAIVWANTRWAASYVAFWQQPMGVRLGGFAFERTLQWCINDVLMVVFFFVAGLEIRRELHHGELSEWRRASLPLAAALGGMVAPVCIYLALAGSPEARIGWGVPMATDIAFAIGILALLGPRIPPALRVLLLALAVIDDLGAIVVIALFYSSGVSWVGLFVAVAALLAILLLQRMGVRTKLAYAIPAVVAWAGVYGAHIHPTIAGVVIGLMTPVRAWPKREAASPAESLLSSLHPWVAYGIMPLFALANAGVALTGSEAGATMVFVSSAIALLVGKPVGILLACALALRARVSKLPVGLSARHLVVLGTVAGVGFTMSLFLAQLSFADATLLAAAKRGVLVASGGAAAAALLLGRLALPRWQTPGAALTADEAECSTET